MDTLAEKIRALAAECQADPQTQAVACVLYCLCGMIEMGQEDEFAHYIQPLARRALQHAKAARAQQTNRQN